MIVDEVDLIFIDEVWILFIIFGFLLGEVNCWFVEFVKIVCIFVVGEDYEVDEKKCIVGVFEFGIEKVEDYFGIDNFYEFVNMLFIFFLNNLIKVFVLFKKDIDYVVMNDEVMIVDEYIGCIFVGCCYNEGIY